MTKRPSLEGRLFIFFSYKKYITYIIYPFWDAYNILMMVQWHDTKWICGLIAGVGVTTDCDDMSYGIGYSWQKGGSVSNNAWTVSASYHF